MKCVSGSKKNCLDIIKSSHVVYIFCLLINFVDAGLSFKKGSVLFNDAPNTFCFMVKWRLVL